MQLRVSVKHFELARDFAISRGSKREAVVVDVQITRGEHVARGESVPYTRYGETPEGVAAAISSVPWPLRHEDLPQHLPPGAARNALDCAFWDLRAKMAGQSLAALTNTAEPQPCDTAFTLSKASPDQMAEDARTAQDYGLLKLKLGDRDDLTRLKAVRHARPDAQLMVDANEAWNVETYEALMPQMADLGVALVEQPFPEAEDEALMSLARPVPVCADESFHGLASFASVIGKYDAVNVKLDKTGGLTEAREVVKSARELGFQVMVGCMVCSSLSIAPALHLAAEADFVDLDGPLWLAKDREGGIATKNGMIIPPNAGFWG